MAHTNLQLNEEKEPTPGASVYGMGQQLTTEQLKAVQQTGVLSLSDMQLPKMPPEIRQLRKWLKHLNLNNNLLPKMPLSVGSLNNLQKFSMSFNIATMIPEEAGKLSNLESFIMSDNKVTTISPEAFGGWISLTELDLSNNEIILLPDTVLRLKKLRILNLSGNKFSAFPIELCKLLTLQTLHFDKMALRSLPPALGNLTNLQVLTLSENGLTQIPETIGRLSLLKELDLSSNTLESLPASVGHLTSLTSLNLSSNSLPALPNELGHCLQLRVLCASNNRLVDLFETLPQLVNLEELVVSSNEIHTLPNDMSSMTALKTLNIVSNAIEMLPKSLAQCHQLETLETSGNPLPAILRGMDCADVLAALREERGSGGTSRFRISIRPANERKTAVNLAGLSSLAFNPLAFEEGGDRSRSRSLTLPPPRPTTIESAPSRLPAPFTDPSPSSPQSLSSGASPLTEPLPSLADDGKLQGKFSQLEVKPEQQQPTVGGSSPPRVQKDRSQTVVHSASSKPIVWNTYPGPKEGTPVIPSQPPPEFNPFPAPKSVSPTRQQPCPTEEPDFSPSFPPPSSAQKKKQQQDDDVPNEENPFTPQFPSSPTAAHSSLAIVSSVPHSLQQQQPHHHHHHHQPISPQTQASVPVPATTNETTVVTPVQQAVPQLHMLSPLSAAVNHPTMDRSGEVGSNSAHEQQQQQQQQSPRSWDLDWGHPNTPQVQTQPVSQPTSVHQPFTPTKPVEQQSSLQGVGSPALIALSPVKSDTPATATTTVPSISQVSTPERTLPRPLSNSGASPNLLALSPVAVPTPVPKSPSIKAPHELLQTALQKLQAGQFTEGFGDAVQAAVSCASQRNRGVSQQLAQQASAVAFACRLVHANRLLDAKQGDMARSCLFSRVVADLSLPPQQHQTAVLAAITRNRKCGNHGTAARLIKTLLPSVSDAALRKKLDEVLEEVDGGIDGVLPLYICPRCKRSVSCGAPSCGVCAEPVRLCFKTLQLIQGPRLDCRYCNATFSNGAVLPDSPCDYCGCKEMVPSSSQTPSADRSIPPLPQGTDSPSVAPRQLFDSASAQPQSPSLRENPTIARLFSVPPLNSTGGGSETGSDFAEQSPRSMISGTDSAIVSPRSDTFTGASPFASTDGMFGNAMVMSSPRVSGGRVQRPMSMQIPSAAVDAQTRARTLRPTSMRISHPLDLDTTDPYQLARQAANDLSSGSLSHAKQHALAAARLFAATKDHIRNRAAVRQCAAVYFTADLVSDIRKLDSIDSTLIQTTSNAKTMVVCLYSRVAADLPLPPKQKTTALVLAIKRNMHAGNTATALRLVRMILSLVDVSSEQYGQYSDLEQQLSNREVADTCLQKYTCAACQTTNSSGNDVCLQCGEAIRLCFKTKQLIESATFYECPYCASHYSITALEEGPCPLCHIPAILQARVKVPDTEDMSRKSSTLSALESLPSEDGGHGGQSEDDDDEDDNGDNRSIHSGESMDSQLSALSTLSTVSTSSFNPDMRRTIMEGIDINKSPLVIAAREYKQNAMKYLSAGNMRHAVHDIDKALQAFVRCEDPKSVKEEIRVCVMYKYALRLLFFISQADASATTGQRAATLSMVLGRLPLDPVHAKTCISMAISRNLKVSNFGIAARFIQLALQDPSHSPQVTQQLRENLRKCQTEILNNKSIATYKCPQCNTPQGADAIKCTLCDLPVLWCRLTFQPIDLPQALICPFCESPYSPSAKSVDTRCEYCNYKPMRVVQRGATPTPPFIARAPKNLPKRPSTDTLSPSLSSVHSSTSSVISLDNPSHTAVLRSSPPTVPAPSAADSEQPTVGAQTTAEAAPSGVSGTENKPDNIASVEAVQIVDNVLALE